MPRRKASLDSFWPKRALIKIKAAIFSYRNERSPSVLLIHTVYALGATVVDLVVKIISRSSGWQQAEYRALSDVERFRLMGHNQNQQRQRYRHRQTVEKTSAKPPQGNKRGQ